MLLRRKSEEELGGGGDSRNKKPTISSCYQNRKRKTGRVKEGGEREREGCQVSSLLRVVLPVVTVNKYLQKHFLSRIKNPTPPSVPNRFWLSPPLKQGGTIVTRGGWEGKGVLLANSMAPPPGRARLQHFKTGCIDRHTRPPQPPAVAMETSHVVRGGETALAFLNIRNGPRM